MTTKNQSGIYRIKNLVTGALYIGQTSETFTGRWGRHRRALKACRHTNAHLQNSYNKHGKDAFEYRVLEVVPRGDMSDKEFESYLNEREIILISELDTLKNGYNFTEGGGGTRGYAVSEEAKAKISRAHKGRKTSAETKAKMSAAAKGKKKGPFTAEHRANLSAAQKGKKHTAETRAKISAAQKGKKYTDEARANMSAWQKGKPWSLARRAAYEASKR